MRRSKAPSQVPFEGSSAATEGVLKILQSSENHINELKRETSEDVPSIRFSVVFGKKSTKKHKTYDEDGILEIRNGILVLKSSCGRYLGTGNLTKHKVVEGGVISLAGLDVLIGEELSSSVGLSPKMSKLSREQASRTSFKSPVVPGFAKTPDGPKKVLKFSVVWGPVSMKKHKTWEGDGMLEIVGKVARLRDDKGKLQATDYNLKETDLTEGSRLTMEGKEMEIIEAIDAEPKTPEPLPKCPRLTLPFRPPTVVDVAEEIPQIPVAQIDRNINYGHVEDTSDSWSPTYSPTIDTNTSLAPTSEIIYEPGASQLEVTFPSDDYVVLPPPPYDHQLQYNTKRVEVSKVVIPSKLAKHLRPHQKEGVIFLYKAVMGFHQENEVECHGAVLADEMGLGKTIQCITLMYILLKQGPYGKPIARNILVVTPSSLVDNWKQEIVKWLEHDRIYTFEVSTKNKPHEFAQYAHIPIMIVSYEMFVKQHAEINAIPFDLMICDEGHRLKNSSIKAATLLDQNACRRRIILTGTPIQNDLEEFFSLVNFVNPGVLGTYPAYKVKFETPIVQSQQSMVLPAYKALGRERATELADITNSFFLRRTQDINRKYLPPKQEVVVFCQPSELQQLVMTQILRAYAEERSIQPLALITILKKVCNHPLLLNEGDGQYRSFLPPVHKIGMFDSSKVELTHSLLTDVFKRGEKVVLVSYFQQTLDLLAALCRESQFQYVRLDGATPGSERGKIVKAFNAPESEFFVFLLSAKAGGAGLNLVGASRLILFDNDWNPATDLQAMSRIWRDGQQRPVFIYRLVTCSTIEEKIFQRQASKTSLGGRVIDHSKTQEKIKFSDEELRDLFSIPANFTACLTHDSLNCKCQGTGDVPGGGKSSQELDGSSSEDENPYKLVTKRKKASKETLQMHEFMKYEHHSVPIKPNLMEELCLTGAVELISFIFRSQVNADAISTQKEDAPSSQVQCTQEKWSAFLDSELC